MAGNAPTKTAASEKESPPLPFGLYAFAPGSGQMRVQLTGITPEENTVLNIYNTQGQMVESRVRLSNGALDFVLSRGLYLVHLRGKTGVIVRRVVVQ